LLYRSSNPVHSPATGGRQFNKQHRVQNAEDGAINVAVDVMKKVSKSIGVIF
jgi:hypothetical protein